eukprot:4740896-Ditylum_brightwellii.AAC.1
MGCQCNLMSLTSQNYKSFYFSTTQVVKDHGGLGQFKVLECAVKCHKTSDIQHLKFFTYKSDLAFCVYFYLGHFLVVDEDPESNYLFADHADKVISLKDDIESNVSKDWKEEFK